LIAIPTGVKIFNWIGTLWGGQIRFTTSMLFAMAFIAMFIIGGLSGVSHAAAPSDLQQTDTYYVVAHIHYVLFGGTILGLFAGGFAAAGLHLPPNPARGEPYAVVADGTARADGCTAQESAGADPRPRGVVVADDDGAWPARHGDRGAVTSDPHRPWRCGRRDRRDLPLGLRAL